MFCQCNSVSVVAKVSVYFVAYLVACFPLRKHTQAATHYLVKVVHIPILQPPP